MEGSDFNFNFEGLELPDTTQFNLSEHENYIKQKFQEDSTLDIFAINIITEDILKQNIPNKVALDTEISRRITPSKRTNKKIFDEVVENKSTDSNFVKNSGDISSIFSAGTEVLEPEDYFVFFPSKRDMRTEYPELVKYVEFKDLSNKELIFVWYFANQTSPYFGIEDHRHKVALCIKEAFGKTLEPHLIDNYMNANYPEKVRVAIQKMNRFNPSVRMKGKMMFEKIMSDWQVILSRNVNKMTTKEKEAHVGLTQKISAGLPNIIEQIEDSFGVKISSKKDTVQFTEMDIILSEDQQDDNFDI